MFQQAKMFEVCRTIVFNDRSFLTRPEWRKASQRLWSDGGLSEEWRPLDSLVDIMLLCPDLRYRCADQSCTDGKMLTKGAQSKPLLQRRGRQSQPRHTG